jgi:rhamnose utilization protein RhaD (predicted bifunctional aldolase and dehydrogenase)/NAD(P)-dependent dehydrogenase (short-subunit alcohol dehydrogenase family)
MAAFSEFSKGPVMHSLWSDAEAERFVDRYATEGVGRDLALRVYTSRLLGGDPKLVLHGGGNTSVKTVVRDLLDDEAEVLCVKGSGWDMAAIEPAGLPAVRLQPLRRLLARERLSDEEMVRVQRANLIDPGAPNPSVETLLHAFLPHKFVDHTHSTAVLALADQPDAAERCADLYRGRLGLVPYIMPGFQLAKKAAEIFEDDPAVEGLVLLKHGVFTFGDTARQAYERMISAVSEAEGAVSRRRNTSVFPAARLPVAVAGAAEVAPILRGACAIPSTTLPGAYKRFILEFRTSPAIRDYVGGAEIGRYSQAGVATPDHTLRTKNQPLLVPAPEAGRIDKFAAAVRGAVDRFVADYHAYFARYNQRQAVSKREIDPMPRVILVPGLGIFGLGGTARDARIAADIAESTVATVTDAEAVGRFAPVGEADLFDIEYWSLEQAKLGQAIEKPLAGQIALVTGGAGTIGLATARAMARNGAEVAVLDIDRDAAAAAAKALGGAALGLGCDVTDPAAVRAAFDRVAAHFGGVDIVVSNAGAAAQGKIGEVEDAVLRRSFELNFFAHQTVAQNAVRVMLAQGIGGCLLFNVSRQAVSQGPNAGPYGLPKAATLFLMKQYALEYAGDGIRANAVNADGIKSGLLTPQFIAERAAAYGLSETQYMARNLLHREVSAEDVADAFVALALARNTTGSFAPVDGGNLAAAPR